MFFIRRKTTRMTTIITPATVVAAKKINRVT
jgi:hypothetical protein